MTVGTTDVGQAQIDREMAEAAQEAATMNAKAAVTTAEQTRDNLTARIVRLEIAVNNLLQANQELNRKYNLLLTERFNTGPTVTDGDNG